MLELDLANDEQVNKIITWQKFEADNTKKYKFKDIYDITIYAKKLDEHYPPALNYLILLKGYLEEKKIMGPTFAMQDIQKVIQVFHKDHYYKII